MNKLILLLLLNSAYLVAQDCQWPLSGRSHISPRSQSVNAARELVGWHRYIYQYEAPGWYGAAAATPAYEHSFRPARLAEYFFGSDCITIEGSQVPQRQFNALLADYFGLSPEYTGIVQLKPEISTWLIDLAGFWGYKNWFFSIHAPIVWTKWDFQLCETQTTPDPIQSYPNNYMGEGIIPVPSRSWQESMTGDITWGEISEGIQAGKISCGALSTKKLSDVQLALGYNFYNRPDGHVGLSIRGSIPTGTRPNAEYLFEPIVGNGHHPELGIGFWGHQTVWERDAYDQIQMWAVVNVTHLFKTEQCRSFDLCPNGFWSRYELAKEFNENGMYIQNTIPLINRTTLCCDVSADAQFDIVVMASYLTRHVTLDLGYNAWLRTHERIDLKSCFERNRYALKGIQNLATMAGPSNATQHCATIFGNNFADQALVADQNPPVFILPQEIDLRSGANSRTLTHKIFGNLQWSFEPNSWAYIPFLGAGGQVEFEGLHPRSETEPNKISISQWSLWLKGGFGF